MSGDGSVRHDKRVEGEVFECDKAGNPVSGAPTAVPLVRVLGDRCRNSDVSTSSGVIAYRVPL